MMRQTVGLSFSSLQQDVMFTQLTCQPGFCVCVCVCVGSASFSSGLDPFK